MLEQDRAHPSARSTKWMLFPPWLRRLLPQRLVAQGGLALTLLVAGFVVGLLLTAHTPRRSKPAVSRSYGAMDVTAQTALSMLDEQQQLRTQLQSLREQMSALQKDAAGSQGNLQQLQQQLEQQRQLVGLSALQGPGVHVTLDDSQRDVEPNDPSINRYVIHQQQLVSLLGVLWNGGAEAIAINDQRITDQSSVYCVGSTVVVNQALLSPPFRVQAIGDPEALERAVVNAPELRDLWERREEYGITVQIERDDQIHIPAHSGRLASHYLFEEHQQ